MTDNKTIDKILTEAEFQDRLDWFLHSEPEPILHEGATHIHILEDGTRVVHSHEEASQGHTHSHGHTHNNTKAVLNRLSRAIGHLESVKRMVEGGRDCSDVLIQLAAVRSALGNTAKVILKDHIENCIVDAVEHGDHEAIENLEKAIDSMMK